MNELVKSVLEYIKGIQLPQIILAVACFVVALLAGIFLGGAIFYKKGYKRRKKMEDNSTIRTELADEIPLAVSEEEKAKTLQAQQEILRREQVIKQQAKVLLAEKERLKQEQQRLAEEKSRIDNMRQNVGSTATSNDVVQGDTLLVSLEQDDSFAKVDSFEIEAEKRRREEEEARQKEEARRRQEDLIRKQAEELARKQAEELARRQAEELARRQAEEQARLQAEELARLQAEEQARLQAEELARLQEEERLRLQEEEAKKQAQQLAEEERRREAIEQSRRNEEQRRLNAEEQEKRMQTQVPDTINVLPLLEEEQAVSEVNVPSLDDIGEEEGGGVLDDKNLERVIAERRANGIRIITKEQIVKHVQNLIDPVQGKAVCSNDEEVPDQLYADARTFGFIFERKMTIKLILCLDADSAKSYKDKLDKATGLASDWYYSYVDVNFDSRSEVFALIDRAYYYVVSKHYTQNPSTNAVHLNDVKASQREETELANRIAMAPKDVGFIELSDRLDPQQGKKKVRNFEMYNKEELVRYANTLTYNDVKSTAVYRAGIRPTSLKAGTRTFAMVYEKANVVKMVIRAPQKAFDALKATYTYVTKAKFPKGADWYSIILDDSFNSNKEIEDLLLGCFTYVCKKSASDGNKKK